MAKRMLIDATHPEETRVVVVDGTRLEEFDFETTSKQQLKGNVYLAKVTRVEPSLQAAFVEYGGNRHGFLAFSEVHPDYYRIPMADREALFAAEREAPVEPEPEAGRNRRRRARPAAAAILEKRSDRVAEDAQVSTETVPQRDVVPSAQFWEEVDWSDATPIDPESGGEEIARRQEIARLDKEVSHQAAAQLGRLAEHPYEVPGDDTEVKPISGEDASSAAYINIDPDDVRSGQGGDGEEKFESFELRRSSVDRSDIESEDGDQDIVEFGTEKEAGGSDETGEPNEPGADRSEIEDTDFYHATFGNADFESGEADWPEVVNTEVQAAGEAEGDMGGRHAAEPVELDRPVHQPIDTVGGDESDDEDDYTERQPRRHYRSYKIQEVIKRRQIMLVQVTKEERGTKGAALTTYLSLAGRYCVLMPNTPRGGGVSRKIANPKDRKRMKVILDELQVPDGMAVILRTAGMERTKAEIKRDFDYLLRLWDLIREQTLKSTAPCVIHEEANLIKRAIRDLYTRDIDEVLVAGENGYRIAKDFMRMLMPSHAKKVQHYREPVPLFHRYQVEGQIDALHSPDIQLRSGGYIVINPTEALVAIDVNSGRSTRERNIEETAYKTNLEAADEIALQLRLRDLAGLIVIDFIDMEDDRHNAAVERRLKEAMRTDRARIQLGRISPFGLLELSRQRLRPSFVETHFEICPTCHGLGLVRTLGSAALHVLRAIEDEGIKRQSSEIVVYVPTEIALYILNQKRQVLAEIEQRYAFEVLLGRDDTLISPDFRLERTRARSETDEIAEPAIDTSARLMAETDAALAAGPTETEVDVHDNEPEADAAAVNAAPSAGVRRPSRRGRGRRDEPEARPSQSFSLSQTAETAWASTLGDEEIENEADHEADAREQDRGAALPGANAGGEDRPRKKRRRGKRGGRRRAGQREEGGAEFAPSEDWNGTADGTGAAEPAAGEIGPGEWPASVDAEVPSDGEPVRDVPVSDQSPAVAAAELERAERGEPRRRRRPPRHQRPADKPGTAPVSEPWEFSEPAEGEAFPPEAQPSPVAEPAETLHSGEMSPMVSEPEASSAEESVDPREVSVLEAGEQPVQAAMAQVRSAGAGADEEPLRQPPPDQESSPLAPVSSASSTEPDETGPDSSDRGGTGESQAGAEQSAANDASSVVVNQPPERPRRGWWQRLMDNSSSD